MECQRCGRVTDATARYCPDCGGPLAHGSGGNLPPGNLSPGNLPPGNLPSGNAAVAGAGPRVGAIVPPVGQGAGGVEAYGRGRGGHAGGGGQGSPGQGSLGQGSLGQGGGGHVPGGHVPGRRDSSGHDSSGHLAGPGHGSNALAPRAHESAAGAHLAVISQDGSTGDVHWLQGDSVDIGREVSGIRLPSDRFVSPRHCRVSRRNGKFFVRDLESLNGVYIRLREPVLLRHGDSVLLGSEVLAYEIVPRGDGGFGVAQELGTDVYGSPVKPRYARLRQRTMEGLDRNLFYLTAEEVVVGRENGDIVFTADSFMSRKHAAFERDASAGSFVLRDLGSSNGTYLGIRGETELREGDHLRVGQHLFRFGLGE